jgi:hypothetical protein
MGIYRPIQQYTQLQRPRDSHVHDTPTDQGILIFTFCKQTWRWETPILTGKTACVCVCVGVSNNRVPGDPKLRGYRRSLGFSLSHLMKYWLLSCPNLYNNPKQIV